LVLLLLWFLCFGCLISPIWCLVDLVVSSCELCESILINHQVRPFMGSLKWAFSICSPAWVIPSILVFSLSLPRSSCSITSYSPQYQLWCNCHSFLVLQFYVRWSSPHVYWSISIDILPMCIVLSSLIFSSCVLIVTTCCGILSCQGVHNPHQMFQSHAGILF